MGRVHIRKTVQISNGPFGGEGEGRLWGAPSLNFLEERWLALASTAVKTDFVDLIASEMAIGVEKAVDCWMSQVDRALTDVHLTSLGRLNAAREILDKYKRLTGKEHLECRKL
jgi:hypothetical protein